MDPIQYVTALRKNWPVLVALLLIGALGGALYASLQPSLYRASSSVFVSSQRGDTTSELVQASNYTQNLVQSYAELATQPAVLNPVIDRLGLDRSATSLANSISTEITINTVIITISAVDTDPARAAAIADGVSGSLATVVATLSPTSADLGPAITMTPVAAASVPTKPFSPNVFLFVTLGAAAGLLLGVVFALARQLLDTRLRGEDDVKALKELAEIPFLGSLARRRGRKTAPVVMFTDPHSIAAEDYRRLCTNLEFAGIDERIRSLAVTSSLAGEGKTTTSLNLAAAVAERGHRVLLVDADLRRPAIANYLNIEGAVGLTSVLLGTAAAEDAIQPIGSFDVLPSGTAPPNVTQLVTSGSMARLMAELIERYDFVVVDSPPLLPATDALTFAKLTDGAVIVVRHQHTRRHQLSHAVRALNVVNAPVLGVVLNGVDKSEVSAYGYSPVAESNEAVLPMSQQAPKSFFRDPSSQTGAAMPDAAWDTIVEGPASEKGRQPLLDSGRSVR